MAIRHIKAGEELTITYQSYDPEDQIDDYDTEFERSKGRRINGRFCCCYGNNCYKRYCMATN